LSIHGLIHRLVHCLIPRSRPWSLIHCSLSFIVSQASLPVLVHVVNIPTFSQCMGSSLIHVSSIASFLAPTSSPT
jgi:hypothetical protein